MKPLLLSDFDGVINAPTNHLFWTDSYSKGIYPDPEIHHHEDRVLDELIHYTTDSVHYHEGGYGVNKLRWSSELVSDYRNLIVNDQVEFIWFTGWKEGAVKILTPLFNFPNAEQYIAPINPGETVSDIGHVWKIEAIIDLYKNQPKGRPFIWLDDLVTEQFRNTPDKGEKFDWLMEQIGNPPALIMHIDERYGVTRKDMQQIHEFIQKHS